MTTVRSLRDLFEAVLLLPLTQRTAFLDRECTDAAMRDSVERMLTAHGGNSLTLLEHSLVDLASKLAPADTNTDAGNWVGRTIGGFMLVEAIGEGGSSVVYRAERAHEGVTQRVAVKVFRRIMLGAAERQRFRRERNALAKLNHPSIASYIDGGVTDSGIAYIAMELVQGERITNHLRECNATVSDRLRLMVEVCRAVEAAHRALIVHRDLKPSNVLVTVEGRVKLLDFGIAKFLHTTDDVTETQHRALTPAYAAPEQFVGEAITTATDVYSLGILLVEVLTGQPPAGRDPKAPSTLVSEDTLDCGIPQPATVVRRLLRGDIDNIAMKATAREARYRYPTAEALATDLGHFLSNQPVSAHPPSLTYVLRKFVQRNAMATLVGVGAVIGIGTSMGAALIQADKAREQAARAESTRDFLVSVFRSAEPAGPQARPATVSEVTAAAIIQARQDRALDPAVRADLLTELGGVLRGQGEFETAEATLREVLAEVTDREGPRSQPAARAHLELAQTLIEKGNYGGAEAEMALVDAMRTRLAPDLRARHSSLQAVRYAKVFDEEHALAATERALRDCAGHCSVPMQFQVLETAGIVYGTFKRNQQALAAYDEAYQLARSTFGDVHVQTASVLNGRAGALRRIGRLEAALTAQREVSAIDEQTLPSNHWRRSVHLNYLGNLQAEFGDLRAAIESFEQARRIWEASFGVDDPELANDLNNIGMMEARLGEYARAIEYLTDALVRSERGFGKTNRLTAMIRCNLGHASALSGELDRGRSFCEDAILDLRSGGDGARIDLVRALRKLGQQRLWAGDPGGALQCHDEALHIAQDLGADIAALEIGQMKAARASALLFNGDQPAARVALQEALAQILAHGGAPVAEVEAHLGLAELALREGERVASKEHLATIDVLLETLASTDPFTRRRITALKAALAP